MTCATVVTKFCLISLLKTAAHLDQDGPKRLHSPGPFAIPGEGNDMHEATA